MDSDKRDDTPPVPDVPKADAGKKKKKKKNRKHKSGTVALNAAIGCKATETAGRTVVTRYGDGKIDPGTCVLLERPVAVVIFSASLNEWCSICLRRSKMAHPCDGCGFQSVCGREACTKYHDEVECQLFKVMKDAQKEQGENGIDPHLALLVVRMLLAPLRDDEERETYKLFEESAAARPQDDERAKGPRVGVLRGSTEEVDGLLEHRERFAGTEWETAVRHGLTVLVKTIREKYGTLPERARTRLIPNADIMDDDIAELVDRLYGLACRCNVNSHGIRECALRGNFGAAMYPKLALFNHSCLPNACYHVNARTGLLEVRTITGAPLPVGSELHLNYGSVFAATHDRMSNLRSSKNFECGCIRCADGDQSDAKEGLNLFKCRTCKQTCAVPISEFSEELDSEEAVGTCPGCQNSLIRSAAMYAVGTMRVMKRQSEAAMEQGHYAAASDLMTHALRSNDDPPKDVRWSLDTGHEELVGLRPLLLSCLRAQQGTQLQALHVCEKILEDMSRTVSGRTDATFYPEFADFHAIAARCAETLADSKALSHKNRDFKRMAREHWTKCAEVAEKAYGPDHSFVGEAKEGLSKA